jgi:hypothetical protein
MRSENAQKEIVTVSEMASMCGLSRSRFYSLIKEGIMPQPSRNPKTNRPYYNRHQQEQCLLVRKTHCGINGKPILFYSPRPRSRLPSTKRPSVRKAKKKLKLDPIIDELAHGLEQLGLTEVSEKQIRSALADAHPDGHANMPMPTLLMSVWKHLKASELGR